MASRGLLVVMNDVVPKREAEFLPWCGEEHFPAMCRVPGILSAQLYRALDGAPRYLALYEAAEPEAFDEPEYLRLRGWAQNAGGAAANMFEACLNLTVGIYERTLTAPDPEPEAAILNRARGLMVRALEPNAPENDEEFQDWYSTEHVPAMVSAPGAVRGRRYRLNSDARDNRGVRMNYLAIYEAETPEVFSTDAWWSKANTPWTRRIRRYYTSVLRNVYERVI